MAYIDGLDALTRSNYFKKLNDVHLLRCPYSIDNADWIDDVKLWPPVAYPDIYSYLIDTPGPFTRESLKAYKSLEAYNFVLSGWVKGLYVLKRSSSALRDAKSATAPIIIRGRVVPSQRLNEKPHHVWVAVQGDGSVDTGHCTCMAGLGAVCSHVAAVLFKIELASRLGYTSPSCTSQPCAWNQTSMSKVDARRVSAINFKRPKPSMTEDVQSDVHRRSSTSQLQPSQSELDQFMQQLSAAPHDIAVLSTVDPHYAKYIPRRAVAPITQFPAPMTSVFRDAYCSLSLPELQTVAEAVCNDLMCNVSQINALEHATRDQHASDLWHQHRKGRITASMFHTACHIDTAKPASSFVKKVIHGQSVSTAAMRWGRDHEQDARSMYSEIMSASHTNHKVERCGLVLHPSMPYIGASPDGYVSDDCCGQGVLECKCPSAYSPTDAPYIKTDDDGNYTLDCRHSYFYQVQGQMTVCNVTYCDFVVWKMRDVTNADCLIVRVLRDDNFCSQMLENLCQVFFTVVMPCLLTNDIHVHRHGIESQEIVVDANTVQLHGKSVDVICKCQKPRGKNVVILCANDKCQVKLYHLRCVGLRRRPAAVPDWLCPYCKPQA